MRLFRHKKHSLSDTEEERIYCDYVEKVYTLCRRYAHCDELAKDYTQDCFIEIFQNIHKYDESKGDLGGWIYIVSRNLVLKKLKKSKKRRITSVEDFSFLESLTDEEEVALPIDPEDLIKKIQELPEGYRQVLNLFVFEQKSHREISEILGISSSTSRSQLARAKKYLKKTLVQRQSYEREAI